MNEEADDLIECFRRQIECAEWAIEQIEKGKEVMPSELDGAKVHAKAALYNLTVAGPEMWEVITPARVSNDAPAIRVGRGRPYPFKTKEDRDHLIGILSNLKRFPGGEGER